MSPSTTESLIGPASHRREHPAARRTAARATSTSAWNAGGRRTWSTRECTPSELSRIRSPGPRDEPLALALVGQRRRRADGVPVGHVVASPRCRSPARARTTVPGSAAASVAKRPTAPTGSSRFSPVGSRCARRGVHGAAEDRLGDHEQPAAGPVNEGLGVVGAVGVAQLGTPGRRRAGRPGPTRDPGDHDVGALLEVVADVADPDRARARGGQRLGVDGGRSAHQVWPDRAPVAGPSTKTTAASPESLVVTISRPRSTSPQDSVICGSAAGRENGRTRPRRPGAASPATRASDRQQDPHDRPSSRPSSGVTPQAAVAASYSSRPARWSVRTARIRVLRGVCSLPTNSTTSTR